MFKLDLHVHFRRLIRKFDTHVEAMILAAIGKGLHGIVFTEHHEFLPQEWVDFLNDYHKPFKIYSGVEVSCGEDILVYGVHDRALCKKWDYLELCKFVEEKNGAICLAHPFRKRDYLKVPIEKCKPNYIELSSRNTPTNMVEKIKELGISLLVNSDSHHPRHIGDYWSECPRLPAGDKDLANMLCQGLFFPPGSLV